MPPSEGHVKDATDHKYDFLRPVALMCISLPNSQSLVHWFRLWFYITARCNLSPCKTAKEKINFSLDRGLPLQQVSYIEVWIRSHKPLWQIENVNMLESIMCLEQLHKTQENLSFFVNFFLLVSWLRNIFHNQQWHRQHHIKYKHCLFLCLTLGRLCWHFYLSTRRVKIWKLPLFESRSQQKTKSSKCI